MGVLSGCRILVTSGPTWARIDAVRFIGNRSSGRFGSAIAAACWREGAAVTLLAGPGSVVPQIPSADSVDGHSRCGCMVIVRFETLNELGALLERQLAEAAYDAVIHAAAVLDYAPEKAEPGKISSSKDEMHIRLVRTPKLIERIKALSPGVVLVGCKLESGVDEEDLFERAEDLHQRSGADLVIANRVEEVSSERHRAYLLSWPEEVRVVTGPVDGRERIARELIGWLVHHLPVSENTAP